MASISSGNRFIRPALRGIVASILSAILLSACSGSGSDGNTAGNDPVNPGGSPPPQGPFTQASNAVLGDVIEDFFVRDPVADDEYSADTFGNQVLRTGIKIVFTNTATVGEVNTLLTDIEAELIATLRDYPAAVVRIPDPGSLDSLRTLISTLVADGIVHSVLESQQVVTQSLPANLEQIIFSQGDPASADQWATIDHHLAIRGAGAWSIQALSQSKPAVVIMDFFGGGDPDPAHVDVEPLQEGADLGFFASPLATDSHGYEMLSIIAARHSAATDTSPEDLATGMNPNGIRVGASDMTGISAAAAEVFMMQTIRRTAESSPGVVIANMSIGRDCDPNVSSTPCNSGPAFDRNTIDFIRSVRRVGEDRVLFVVAAGNIENNGSRDAETQSEWAAAGLGSGWTDPVTQETIQPLENVLVIENAVQTATAKPPFAAGCVHASSFVGGELAGIGENVYGLLGPDDTPTMTAGNTGGSSHATAQVAGLAAYVSSLRPELDALQLKTLLLETARAMPGQGGNCSTDGSFAKVVDAYAAALTMDPTGQTSPGLARARLELLDITAADMGDTPDGVFNIHDLRKWIPILDDAAQPDGITDYGRFDLNGNGTTGGPATDFFDLDQSYDVDNPASSLYTNVSADFLGVSASYDETAVTDMELVCYYAATDLYELGTVEPFTEEARDRELQKAAAFCDPCQKSATASTKSAFGLAGKPTGDDPVCEDPPMLAAATKVTDFGGEGVILKVSADGSVIEQLTVSPDPFRPNVANNPAWSPDRSRIAFNWNLDDIDEIWVMNSDGSGKQQLTFQNADLAHHYEPVWSPDGLKIAYIRRNRFDDSHEIWVMNADGTDRQQMLSPVEDVFELSWSPDGLQMLYSQGETFRNPTTVTLVLADVVVEEIGEEEIWSLQNPIAFAGVGTINRSPEWSPDSRRIAFSSRADASADADIYTVAADGTDLTRITGPDEPFVFEDFVIQQADLSPSWAPSGTRLALVRRIDTGGSAEDTTNEIFLVNPDGTDLVQLTPTDTSLTLHSVTWGR